VRWTVALYVVAFGQAFGWHLSDVIQGGLHAYSWAPEPIGIFFLALLLLDPLTVGLAARLRPAAVIFASSIMVLDTAANWYVDWHSMMADPWLFARPFGLTPITLFAFFVLATGVPLRRELTNGDAQQVGPEARVAGP
jgi:hypothetical protein